MCLSLGCSKPHSALRRGPDQLLLLLAISINMAARTSSTGAYKVPDWAVKNKEIFLSAASRKRGVAPPARKERSPLRMSLVDLQAVTAEIKAAMSMSVLAEVVSNGISPPTVPPSADYFRDVANHPDVLSTIISTARATVGFRPDTNGTELSETQIKEYIEKFNEFLDELDKYYVYIDLKSAKTETVQNNSIDCSLMLSTITSVLAAALGLATSGSVFEALVESASSIIRTAVNYVSEDGKATSANFEMVGLPKSNAEGEDAYRDPISAVTFTATTLSQQTSGKTTSQNSSITISANSYQLKSSAIIEYADHLAGSTITGNTELRDYINSLLN